MKDADWISRFCPSKQLLVFDKLLKVVEAARAEENRRSKSKAKNAQEAHEALCVPPGKTWGLVNAS